MNCPFCQSEILNDNGTVGGDAQPCHGCNATMMFAPPDRQEIFCATFKITYNDKIYGIE